MTKEIRTLTNVSRATHFPPTSWKEGGPFLPIELARESKDKRITLVIVSGRPEVRSVQTLWIPMKTQDIATKKEKLTIREGLKNGWKNESKKKARIEKT